MIPSDKLMRKRRIHITNSWKTLFRKGWWNFDCKVSFNLTRPPQTRVYSFYSWLNLKELPHKTPRKKEFLEVIFFSPFFRGQKICILKAFYNMYKVSLAIYTRKCLHTQICLDMEIVSMLINSVSISQSANHPKCEICWSSTFSLFWVIYQVR